MLKAIIIACLTVSVLSACGPSEGDKKTMDEIKQFGECANCGKTKINIFGGDAK